MSTFKITNITNLLGKREPKYNTTLEIDYIDSMIKKTVKIKPTDSVFLTTPTLPLSVQRLRLKNFVAVVEVSTEELNKHLNNNKPKVSEVNVQEDLVEKKPQHQQINKKKVDMKDESFDTEKDA